MSGDCRRASKGLEIKENQDFQTIPLLKMKLAGATRGGGVGVEGREDVFYIKEMGQIPSVEKAFS